MTIDWTACLVLLTGAIAIVGGFAAWVRLMIRAELASLYGDVKNIERRLKLAGL